MKIEINSKGQLETNLDFKSVIDPEHIMNGVEPITHTRVSREEYEIYVQKIKAIDTQGRQLESELSGTSWELIDITKEDSLGNKTIKKASEIEPFEVFYFASGEWETSSYKRYNLKEIYFSDENELLLNNELKSKYEIDGISFFTYRENINIGIEKIGEMALDNDFLFITDYSTVQHPDQTIKNTHIYRFRKVFK